MQSEAFAVYEKTFFMKNECGALAPLRFSRQPMRVLSDFATHNSLFLHQRDIWAFRIETDGDFRSRDGFLKPARVLLILDPNHEKTCVARLLGLECIAEYAAVCVWSPEPGRF